LPPQDNEPLENRGFSHPKPRNFGLGSLGTRLRTATPRPHETATQELREASNDPMTVEVEMAGRIDRITDAAG
jgi:hypothetical protein